MHELTFRWIRGHTGHPENERCDRMAVGWYIAYLNTAQKG
jgi:ribonuclease HI